MLDSPVDEIKSRLDIIDVLSEYIRLNQAGANWKALCPFHREKTPSFMVSRDKQIWHCFGCGEGGDIFTFLMKIEGLEFPDALRILAQKAGVTLKKQDPTLINKRTRLIDLISLAANFYHKVLLESPKAQFTRDYLKQRGLQEETIKEFKLGYAPEFTDALSQFLIKKDFKPEEIVAAGLAGWRENGQLYDRFRDRLMFPLADTHGNVVGFSGRLLHEQPNVGKYINTPQTLVYDKSKILYPLAQAKQAIKQEDLAIVVEGQMDVLASHQAGIKNVVASSGTALTFEQIKLLKRYTNNLALAFDMDKAGEAAAERGIAAALSQGLEVKVIVLAGFKDPDECIKQDPQLWLAAIKQAKPLMDYYFDKTLIGLDLSRPENKSRAAQILLKIIVQLADRIKQNFYLHKLAQVLEVDEAVLKEKLQTFVKKEGQPPAENLPEEFRAGREVLLAERILALVFKFPRHLNYLADNLRPEMIGGPLQELYKNLIIYYTSSTGQTFESGESFDYGTFRNFLMAQDEVLANHCDVLCLLADKEFADFTEDLIRKEILKLAKFLKEDYISRERKRIIHLMRQAEQEGQQEKINELNEEFNKLLNGF